MPRLLLDAAVQLLNGADREPLTLPAIAAAAGVAKQTSR